MTKSKAKIANTVSIYQITDHFPDVTKMVESATFKPVEFDGFSPSSTLIPQP